MIKTINDLEFEYFTKEELVKYKSSIEDRIIEIENGLIIEERPLKYFAKCDVMYGDADGYSEFTQEIDRESYIKLELFGSLDVCFSHEQMGDTNGIIDDFISTEKSYFDLEEGSSVRGYYSEIEQVLEEIDNHIERFYSENLNLEELFLSYQNDDNFDIKDHEIDFRDPINHDKFINMFIGKEYSHRTDSYQVIEVYEDFGEIIKTILDIKPTKKFLFLNCLELETKHILKVYESDEYKTAYIKAAMYYRAAEVDFIGEFNLRKYFE